MLKKTITFIDFDGDKVTENFYFNLTKAELLELNSRHNGTLTDTLQKITKTEDQKKLIEYFKEIILLAYGERDGNRFRKSAELSSDFSHTEAYSELFMELATNDKSAAEFVKGILPADLVDAANPQDQPALPIDDK